MDLMSYFRLDDDLSSYEEAVVRCTNFTAVSFTMTCGTVSLLLSGEPPPRKRPS